MPQKTRVRLPVGQPRTRRCLREQDISRGIVDENTPKSVLKDLHDRQITVEAAKAE
ncbi:hypothetical protein OHA62_44700 [Streptomyces sp. NBC_00343]|nr:hypothetical protein [Streptomyces sp. NBC_00343]